MRRVERVREMLGEELTKVSINKKSSIGIKFESAVRTKFRSSINDFCKSHFDRSSLPSLIALTEDRSKSIFDQSVEIDDLIAAISYL